MERKEQQPIPQSPTIKMRRILPLQIDFTLRRVNMCKINIPENITDEFELQLHINSVELFSNKDEDITIRIGIIITKDIRKELLYIKLRKMFEEKWWNKSPIAYVVRHMKSVHVLIHLYKISIMPPYAHQIKHFHIRWRPNLIRIMRNNPIWKEEQEKERENTPSTSESPRE